MLNFKLLTLFANKIGMYINLLTQLKNAQAVKKESIKISYSANDEKILEILEKNKFIAGFEKKGRGIKKILSVNLKYDGNEGAITGVRFHSKPSRHLYVGYKDIRPVKSGYGIMIISTPDGIMTGSKAKKMKIGGEMFFEIW